MIDRSATDAVWSLWCYDGVFACSASWLDDWQALIAGVLALLAAGWAAYMVHRQINQVERHETQRKLSRERAARAAVTLTLNKVAAQVKAQAKQLIQYGIVNKFYETRGKAERPIPVFVPQPFSVEKAAQLERSTEAAIDPETVERFSTLLCSMQILDARIGELTDRPRAPMNEIFGYAMDCLVVYAIAASLLEYARGPEAKVKPLAWAQVLAASPDFGISGRGYENMLDKIIAYERAGPVVTLAAQ